MVSHFLNFKRFHVNISLLAIFRLLCSYLWYYYKASLVREEVVCLWQVTFYNTVKEWFWSECRKTKTKVITGQSQITQLANPRMNQGLQNKYIYPTQSAGKHVLASYCYAWSYKVFFVHQSLSVVMKFKSNCELPCIDTSVKTTLLFCNTLIANCFHCRYPIKRY